MNLLIKTINFLFILSIIISKIESKRIRLGRVRTEIVVPSQSMSQEIKSNDEHNNNNNNNTNHSTDNLERPTNQVAIYSEWSKWSRCRKRCKQVRKRICISPSICQSNIQKEERSCTGDRCRLDIINNNNGFVPMEPSNNHLIEPNRGRGRGTEFKVLYHLQSYVYSQWSKWSPCTENCQTRRYRTCEMREICGNSTIHEDAICAKKGSNCEKYFKSKSAAEVAIQQLGEKIESAQFPPVNNSKIIDDETCGRSSVRNDMSGLLRIIGGREASKGRWPWVVAVLNRNHEAFCGGTLITSQFIITAAHCVRRRLYIRAGEHDLVIPEGSEQQEPVSGMFVHPEYDPDTVDNDIALLKLKRPFIMNRFVSPICLPSSDDVLPVNSLGTILGWGKKKNSAMFGSDVLHQAQVPIADSEDCKNVYKDKYMISDNMVCAGYKRGKIDSCAGDSGGPLLFSKKQQPTTATTEHQNNNNSNNGGGQKWFLYGITSFGEGCGKKNKYGIYAKVPNVVQWIRKTIMENMD